MPAFWVRLTNANHSEDMPCFTVHAMLTEPILCGEIPKASMYLKCISEPRPCLGERNV